VVGKKGKFFPLGGYKSVRSGAYMGGWEEKELLKMVGAGRNTLF
jgi:hypothetical protein